MTAETHASSWVRPFPALTVNVVAPGRTPTGSGLQGCPGRSDRQPAGDAKVRQFGLKPPPGFCGGGSVGGDMGAGIRPSLTAFEPR